MKVRRLPRDDMPWYTPPVDLYCTKCDGDGMIELTAVSPLHEYRKRRCSDCQGIGIQPIPIAEMIDEYIEEFHEPWRE